MKFKIPPRIVKSDDCVIKDRHMDDGILIESEGYAIHAGEWVAVYPALSVADRQVLIGAYNAFTGGPETDKEKAEEDMLAAIARNIVDWNWTDIMGEPYPKPYQNLEAMGMLTPDEVLWIWRVIIDESLGERKKGLQPSQKRSSRAKAKPTRAS